MFPKTLLAIVVLLHLPERITRWCAAFEVTEVVSPLAESSPPPLPRQSWCEPSPKLPKSSPPPAQVVFAAFEVTKVVSPNLPRWCVPPSSVRAAVEVAKVVTSCPGSLVLGFWSWATCLGLFVLDYFLGLLAVGVLSRITCPGLLVLVHLSWDIFLGLPALDHLF